MARNNRGMNGIGYLMQATGEVIGGNIGHDNHKLVAAIAHKLVSRTNSAAYGCRHSAERKVAGMTATRIVEGPKSSRSIIATPAFMRALRSFSS